MDGRVPVSTAIAEDLGSISVLMPDSSQLPITQLQGTQYPLLASEGPYNRVHIPNPYTHTHIINSLILKINIFKNSETIKNKYGKSTYLWLKTKKSQNSLYFILVENIVPRNKCVMRLDWLLRKWPLLPFLFA